MMNDETTNTYAIERIDQGVCEHEFILCHDETATTDDVIMLPDAFLESTGACGADASYRVTIDDEWIAEMNCDEPDEYILCETHARLMIDNIDPGAPLA
jgi:hypothetical protein